MNENEPIVEMPEPPAGHRWEYRGLGWDNGGKNTVYCHTTYYSGVARGAGDRPSGIDDYRYWEAVPVDLAESRERFDRACDDHLAEENRKLRKKLEVAERGLSDFKEDWSSRVKQAKNLERENAELKAELAALKSTPIPFPPVGTKLRFTKDNFHGCEGHKAGDAVTVTGDHQIECGLRFFCKGKPYDWTAGLEIVADEPAAYPPPESEWPEKPAPPEGCEWVRLKEGRCKAGDMWLSENGNGWCIAAYSWAVGSTVVFRAEKIDHTEGGKYRMLEEGEKLESGVRRRIDFAQQAKDMLQARFFGGFPTFREIYLDQFVDLIIKAAKQP